MSRKVTSTCMECRAEFSYEYGGRGARRKYCGGVCAKAASRKRAQDRADSAKPMLTIMATCAACDEGFTYRVRAGRRSSYVRKYCGSECRPNAHSAATERSDGGCASCGEPFIRRKSWQKFCSKSCQAGNQQAMKIAKMKADGTYRYCAGCGGDMPQMANRKFCDSPECRGLAAEAQRLHLNAKSREQQRRDRERLGMWGSKRYKDRPYNKNYNYRERHPDRAKRYDHERRARMANCERESFPDSEIFERDGFVCGICNEPVDMGLKFPDAMSASLDHIIPLSRGGGHVRSNVRLAHLGCNARKCARLDEEFITTS